MSDLEELEAIKQVKYKYQRDFDVMSTPRPFEGLAEVLTEDAAAADDRRK